MGQQGKFGRQKKNGRRRGGRRGGRRAARSGSKTGGNGGRVFSTAKPVGSSNGGKMDVIDLEAEREARAISLHRGMTRQQPGFFGPKHRRAYFG